MNTNLTGKIVVVVGGSSGISLAVTQAVATQGAIPVLCSRYEERLRAAQASIAGELRILAFDSLDENQVTTALGTLPRIDHLVVTAVADENALRLPLREMNTDTARRGMEKFRTSFFVARAAVPLP